MSRQPHERCSTHQRSYCTDSTCKVEESNAGTLSVNTEGGMSIGVGGGLAIDLSDGSIGVQVGPITFDTN